MLKEILIEVNPIETRAALIGKKREVIELHIEKKFEKNIVGNIYKGKVLRVQKGLKAVFVDIGLEKSAYMNFEDLKESFNNYIHMDEIQDFRKEFEKFIKKKIKPGEEILVQVTRAGVGDKGPKITTNIAITGRYAVLLPHLKFLGISKKITDKEKRTKLREKFKRFVNEEGVGLILRTASAEVGNRSITRELKFLLRMWKKIQEREKLPAPRLLYQNLSLSLRMVRDHFTEEVSSIIVDDRDEYKKIREFVKIVQPERVKEIKLWKGGPVFSEYGLRNIYDKVLKNIVWLPSGGYIVIQEVEALTAIDVNSGKFSSGGDPDAAFFMINKEAAAEIAVQLRLRDIGGIIIVDFINLKKRKLRKELYEFFRDVLSEDPGKPSIERVSKLGLVEMTRKKDDKSVPASISMRCPYCNGKGYIKSYDTIIGEIYRDIKELVPLHRCGRQKILITTHPDVAERIRGKYIEFFYTLCKSLSFKGDQSFHLEKYTIQFI